MEDGVEWQPLICFCGRLAVANCNVCGRLLCNVCAVYDQRLPYCTQDARLSIVTGIVKPNGSTAKADIHRLGREMEQANRMWADAAAELDRAIKLFADVQGISDGTLALKKARMVHAKAWRGYVEAAKRYRDAIGDSPPDER